MSVVASIISDLVKAGVDPDLVGRVASALAQREPVETRTARQLRNARYYERKASERRLKASEQDVSDDIKTGDPSAYIARADAPVCSNDISNEISKLDNPLPTVGPLKSKSPSPKEILSEVVSEKTAADVVAHRKALRKPLTPRAAELLASSLAASGDAERAAATMIERGWQGYRADWVSGSPNARAGPSQGGGWAKMLIELEKNKREQRPEGGGTREVIPRLPERKNEGCGADDAHDGGVSRNAVELLVGNSFRRM